MNESQVYLPPTSSALSAFWPSVLPDSTLLRLPVALTVVPVGAASAAAAAATAVAVTAG